jgi:hypothetical protein
MDPTIFERTTASRLRELDEKRVENQAVLSNAMTMLGRLTEKVRLLEIRVKMLEQRL